ncbi:ricin-type beta-trefoil lectin domain protein [Nonomuraea sp. NPDC049400]|uniref:ricin-type beta-trefoil lectin domain protein n=1 Tax=Nonomuraea sp. NPDC049400 TaxID=3364352 RepID=UPI00379EA4B4
MELTMPQHTNRCQLDAVNTMFKRRQQQWVLREDGSVYNVRFQRCLDADTNTGGNGGKVQLWDCGPWNQQWWR